MASFAQQYGIRLYREDLEYPEYCNLVSGLSSDTPLGRIVSIRSEMDPKVLKDFTLDQRRIRAEWSSKATARKGKDAQMEEVRAMQTIFKSAFSKPKGVKK